MKPSILLIKVPKHAKEAIVFKDVYIGSKTSKRNSYHRCQVVVTEEKWDYNLGRSHGRPQVFIQVYIYMEFFYVCFVS